MAKTPTWQRKAGQNPHGGLNEAGRRSLKAAGHDIKRPQPEGGSRRDSFCARMKGMKAKLTSAKTANDPDSRINKSLRAWNCADGGAVGMAGGGDAVKAALKLAQDIIHSQNKPPKIENLARVADKFVYHSGVKPDIEHMMPYLEPQHGSWIKEVALGAVDDPEEMLENANPLLWMSDKPNWVKSKIGRHLGKPFNQITDDDIRNYGHVALIPRKGYEAENIWKVGPEGLDNGQYSTVSNLRTGEPTKAYNTDIYQEGREPFGVERNEYISAQPIEPMYHLTGDALLNFLNLTKNRMNGGSVRPEMGAGGSGLKAAVNLARNIIKTYHGSPHQFDKFDLDKLGSGVGAQAYGHGLYTSDNPNVARNYRTVTPGRLPNFANPAPNEITIGGKPVYSVYKDIERQANNVPIAEAGKYYDKLDVLERLMHEGDALAIKQAASDEAFSPEAYKWFQTNIEPKLNTPGGLYEINLHADPKKFIDLYSQISLKDPLRERVESLAQHGLQNADAQAAYRDAQEAMKTVKRKDIFGSDIQGALDTLLEAKGSNVRQVAGISPDIKGPEAVARYLNREGYAGFTYPHGLDAPGPELLNRVVFDPKVMEIVKRYGQGGEVRPEMGGGGNALKAAVNMAQDIIKAYHASGSKFDKFDNSKIGSGVGAQAYGKGHYLASSDPVARGYLGPEAQYDRMSGKMNPKEEFAFDIATNSSDPTTWTIIKPLVEKYGSNISYDEAEKLAEEALAKRGHMYEVGIHANPEHFLNWDKPFRDQSSHVQKALSVEGLGLVPGGPSGEWNGRIGWADETGMPLGPVTTGNVRPSKIFNERDIPASIYRNLGRDNPALSSEKLNAAGIPGIKYLDPSFRHLGEGARNYVVFNPDILDIMRRYADGGRIHFDEGGLARIERLIKEAQGEKSAEEMSHPVGMSGNVEFAPVEINEPMTGSKIPLGSLPAPTAAVVNPLANIMAQYGPYAAGPIPAGMAAARDLVTGIKEGSGLDVATAAMGAPGRALKYGLPALGAVTDILSPTEAQAGPYTKFLRELAEKYRPHYDPSAMIKGQPKDKWISDVALSRPIEQMSVKTTGQRQMIPEARIEPVEMAGKAMISGFGDKTPAGYVVTHINDKKLSNPVDVLGGPAFARDKAAQIDEAYWGSNRSRASALANKGKEAVANKYDPVFSYITQGPQSQDFSHQMTDMILGQLRKKDMDKKLVEQFDQLMREKEIKKGMPGIPTWPGLTSPKLRQWLMESKEGGAGRAKMAKLMDKSMYLKAPGFADVGAARFATTHPSIMNTPIFSSGHMFSRMDPLGTLITNPKVPHPSYDTLLASPKGKQGYIGGFEYELPPELHFHDYLSGTQSGYQSGIRPDLVEKPFTQKTMSLMRETPTVIGTPKWVDMATEYQDIMRYLYGRRP